jgi:opacity protein-like surface antigen
MKSVNTWFASVSIYSILIAVLLSGFSPTSQAQSNSQNSASHFSQKQLDDLQEFARQFREDSMELPPAMESFSTPSHEKNSRRRVPAMGASYANPRQDGTQQEQSDNFDPFSDLRGKDHQLLDDKSVLDPSPDPPADEMPNQVQQPQQPIPQNQFPENSTPRNQDQSNPFTDNRAVDSLRDVDSNRQTKPSSRRRIPGNENWEGSRSRKPVDPAAIRQWESPPLAIVPKTRSQNNPKSAQPTQPTPRTQLLQPAQQNQPPQSSQPPQSLEPSQVQSTIDPDLPQQYPIPYQPAETQPEYWVQPDQSGSYAQPLEQATQLIPGGGYPGHAYSAPGMGQTYQQQPQSSQQPQYHGNNAGAQAQSQAGQGTYFNSSHHQWGAAGVNPNNFGCNACGISDCGFDCEELEFYLSGYGAFVDLNDLVSGSDSLLAENGGGWGIALGRRQGLNLRTELEYGWRSNYIIGFNEDGLISDMTGKIKSQAGMANAYWEFVNFPTCCIKPYVGAGLGVARFDTELRDEFGDSLTSERFKDSSFAYQFMGGVNYQPCATIDLFIEYRLFQTDSFQLETDTGFAAANYSYEASNLVSGLRWKF